MRGHDGIIQGTVGPGRRIHMLLPGPPGERMRTLCGTRPKSLQVVWYGRHMMTCKRCRAIWFPRDLTRYPKLAVI